MVQAAVKARGRVEAFAAINAGRVADAEAYAAIVMPAILEAQAAGAKSLRQIAAVERARIIRPRIEQPRQVGTESDLHDHYAAIRLGRQCFPISAQSLGGSGGLYLVPCACFHVDGLNAGRRTY